MPPSGEFAALREKYGITSPYKFTYNGRMRCPHCGIEVDRIIVSNQGQKVYKPGAPPGQVEVFAPHFFPESGAGCVKTWVPVDAT